MEKTSRRKPPSLKAIIWILLIAVVSFFLSLVFPDIQAFHTVLSTALVLLLAIQLVPLVPDWVEEISGLGFTLRTRKKIEAVRHSQLVNKVVLVKETRQRFWVDDLSVPHEIPDDETAEFLTLKSGTTPIESDELQTLQPIVAPEPMTPIKSATILSNENRDFFILYQDVLYYQHTLAFIYKLAVLKGFDFRGKQIQDDQWSEVIKPLAPEMFEMYQIV